MPFILSTGDTLVVGGNVPAKGGRPDIQLKSFSICPGQTFDDEDNASESNDEEKETKKKAPPKRL